MKGVDALLLGHAHTEFPGPGFAGYPGVDLAKGQLYGTPAVMPGRWGDHLGIVDLTLKQTDSKDAKDGKSGKRWQVVDSQSSLRPIFDRATRKPLVDADPMPAVVIAGEHQATLDYVRSQVAMADQPIQSYFSQVLDGTAVRLVAQAQLAYALKAVQGTALEKLPMLSAAAPFKSGGRQGWTQYTDIPAGPVAIKHVADLYVYPNTIKVVKLSGRPGARLAGDVRRPVPPHRSAGAGAAGPRGHELPELQLRHDAGSGRRLALRDRRDAAGAFRQGRQARSATDSAS